MAYSVPECRSPSHFIQLGQKSRPNAFLAGTPECFVIRKHYVTASIANLAPILKNLQRSELHSRNTVGTARHVIVTAMRHWLLSLLNPLRPRYEE